MRTLCFGVFLCVLAVIGLVNLGSSPPLVIHDIEEPSAEDYVCWANPTKEVVEKCKAANTCDGVGVYAWHKSRKMAKSTAMDFCKKQYEHCEFDYCEQIKK